MSSKITSLAAKNDAMMFEEIGWFEIGFKSAFEIINESLEEEIKKVNEYPWMGERIMTLKLYQKKIASVLKDMEQEYE